MKDLQSVSEFRRRLLPGSKWLMTNTLTGSPFQRVVTRRQATAVVFDTGDQFNDKRESWLHYPAASECSYKNGATILIKLGGEHFLVYKHLERPNGKEVNAPPP